MSKTQQRFTSVLKDYYECVKEAIAEDEVLILLPSDLGNRFAFAIRNRVSKTITRTLTDFLTLEGLEDSLRVHHGITRFNQQAKEEV